MTLEEGEILLEDALALESATWIDARTAEAYEADHIPDSILLNEASWDELFEQFILNWDGQSTLVVYCDSRICAASKGVAERLRTALQTENVLVLKGGWEAWLQHEM